jgi:hypothetical protein
MKWMSLSLLAALALFVNACERHSADETRAAIQEDLGAKPVENTSASTQESEPVADAAPAKAKAPEASAPVAAAPAESKPEQPTAATQNAPKYFDSK